MFITLFLKVFLRKNPETVCGKHAVSVPNTVTTWVTIRSEQ